LPAQPEREVEAEPRRWLKKLVRLPRNKSPALVYVAGGIHGGWGHPDVARSIQQLGVTVYVVAPEARFTECLARPELPDCLWSFTSTPEADVGFARQFRGSISWYERVWSTGRKDEWVETPADTDCPGGFGYPAYCTPVARTDGAYLFYPVAPAEWNDPCPRDEDLLREVAPEPIVTKPMREARRKDPALAAIAEAGRMVAKLEEKFGDLAQAESIAVRDYKRYPKLAMQARAFAEDLGDVWTYLARAKASVKNGEWEGRCHRRSLAQLRYAHFLVEAKAFHLLQWAEAADQVPAFVEKGEGRERYKEKGLAVGIWARQLFRMSGVLPGYGALAKPKVSKQPKPEISFRFGFGRRSRLPDDWALKQLKPEYQAAALRMFEAAREVMAHEAKSPWGWMTYYCDAHTFQPGWSGEGKNRPRYQPPSEDESPETRPERPDPGSGGKGPTSGG
jgi:hypothetical protein